MPYRCTLSLISDETGETISLEAEFSDDEVRLLEAFVQYADEVWDSDFMKSEERGQFNIEWEKESGTKITTVLPDWKQVIVFLHKFRPILLQNEKTQFYKITGILGQKFDHPNFRNSLRVEHELYSGKTAQEKVQFRSDGILLNSERVLFDWLNAHEYHREEDKQKFIESLHHLIPLDASKVIFLRLLIDKATASINIANLIRVILGKQQEVTISMKRP
jgi:hypothetical protein